MLTAQRTRDNPRVCQRLLESLRQKQHQDPDTVEDKGNGGLASSCNRPHPTSLTLMGSLVEGGALMLDSPSVVAGEEGRSSPVPNDGRGRRPHHPGAGLLRLVIPATCATVSLDNGMVAPDKHVSSGESISISHVAGSHRVSYLSGLLASCFRLNVGSPRSLLTGRGPFGCQRDLRSRTT